MSETNNVKTTSRKVKVFCQAHKKVIIGGVVAVTAVVGTIIGVKVYQNRTLGIPLATAKSSLPPISDNTKRAISSCVSHIERINTAEVFGASRKETLFVEPLHSTVMEENEDSLVQKVSRKYTNPTCPIDVGRHIRNLGENRFPSAEKIAEAEMMGIILGEHQTLVDPYKKFLENIRDDIAS